MRYVLAVITMILRVAASDAFSNAECKFLSSSEKSRVVTVKNSVTPSNAMLATSSIADGTMNIHL